jgi:hypothetical protein
MRENNFNLSILRNEETGRGSQIRFKQAEDSVILCVCARTLFGFQVSMKHGLLYFSVILLYIIIRETISLFLSNNRQIDSLLHCNYK